MLATVYRPEHFFMSVGRIEMDIDAMILQLGNVGLLLESVETKGEQNLNNLLAAIQIVRRVRNALREGGDNENRNEQG